MDVRWKAPRAASHGAGHDAELNFVVEVSLQRARGARGSALPRVYAPRFPKVRARSRWYVAVAGQLASRSRDRFEKAAGSGCCSSVPAWRVFL